MIISTTNEEKIFEIHDKNSGKNRNKGKLDKEHL